MMSSTSTHRDPDAQLGRFSTTDDPLEVHDGQPAGGPDLSRDPNRRRDPRPGAQQIVLLLLLLAVALPLLWHFFTR